MENLNYLKNGNSGCAVFEVDKTKNKVIISATLGFSNLLYRDDFSIEDARNLWKELIGKGWEKPTNEEITKKRFSHDYVWDWYN